MEWVSRFPDNNENSKKGFGVKELECLAKLLICHFQAKPNSLVIWKGSFFRFFFQNISGKTAFENYIYRLAEFFKCPEKIGDWGGDHSIFHQKTKILLQILIV